jgi:hypothetical protein
LGTSFDPGFFRISRRKTGRTPNDFHAINSLLDAVGIHFPSPLPVKPRSDGAYTGSGTRR